MTCAALGNLNHKVCVCAIKKMSLVTLKIQTASFAHPGTVRGFHDDQIESHPVQPLVKRKGGKTAPPRWCKKFQCPPHQPAAPEPWSEGRPRLQSALGAKVE